MTNQAQSAEDLMADQVEEILTASRLLIGIAAQSIAVVDRTISLPQMRALVILMTQGEMDLSSLAKAMGVHSSNATRTCDRLVAAGFVDRQSDPGDRRHVRLVPTELGRQLFDDITERRRVAIAQVLAKLAAPRRVAVARALREFSQAGGEFAAQDLQTLGWGSPKKS